MIRVGFLQNPIGFSVFQLFLREGILILKGNYLTCQVRHTIFKMDIYYIGNGLSFYKLHLTDVPNPALCYICLALFAALQNLHNTMKHPLP